LVLGPGITCTAGPNIEEWQVPSDQAAKLSVGRRVRVSLELLEEDQ